MLVEVYSVNAATTYTWTLAYIPESPAPSAPPDPFAGTPSSAALSSTNTQTATFAVDYAGSYLVRLITDIGLPTESTQFVRLRALTLFGQLKLPAAGERRDGTGVIPVDANSSGWTNDLNQNLLRLAGLVRRASSAGRVLYVDSNRGRNNTSPPNDLTNYTYMPGPDPTRQETGMFVTATGFGDFSTINEAIAYALSGGYGLGGDPLPTSIQPFVVVVRDGIYEEAIEFKPFVFVVSENMLYPNASVGGGVIATAPAGTNHTYIGTDPSDYTLVQGISLTNDGSTANPVLVVQDASLDAILCTIHQQYAGANPAVAILVDADGTDTFATFTNCTILSESANSGDPVIQTSGTKDLYFRAYASQIYGPVGVLANTDFSTNPHETILINGACNWWGDGGVLGWPTRLSASSMSLYPRLGAVTPAIGIGLPGNYPPAYPSQVNVDLSRVEGANDIVFDTTNIVGATTLLLSDFQQEIGSGTIVFPNGMPGTFDTKALSKSVRYDTAWVQPETGNLGVTTNPLPSINSVQDAIDILVNVALPITGAPFFSLDSAYNGASSILPFTPGAGAGRTITADEGAVKIEGVVPDVQTNDTSLKGGLQVQGVVDIGPMVSDGYGSEINLKSLFGNGDGSLTDGCGPFISLGRAVTPMNGSATTMHGLPAAVIQAGNAKGLGQTPGADAAPYNLIMRTRNRVDLFAGELGRVVVQGGTFPVNGITTPASGSVYIQGGDNYSTGGAQAGNIYLSPGYSDNGVSGSLFLTQPTNSGAQLLPFTPFIGGVSGSFWIATPNGVEKFTVGAGDNVATVAANITNNSLSLKAVVDGFGNLVLTCLMTGPNGSVIFLGDDCGGALNTALGDFTLSGGATFTSGVFNNKVEIRATGDEEITIGTTLPMVYNGVTGKLTVPGLIDPIGLVLEETDPANVPTNAGHGSLFVSDGSGGTTQHHLYFRDNAGALTDVSAGGGGGGAPTTSTYLTDDSTQDPALGNSIPMKGLNAAYTVIKTGGAVSGVKQDIVWQVQSDVATVNDSGIGFNGVWTSGPTGHLAAAIFGGYSQNPVMPTYSILDFQVEYSATLYSALVLQPGRLSFKNTGTVSGGIGYFTTQDTGGSVKLQGGTNGAAIVAGDLYVQLDGGVRKNLVNKVFVDSPYPVSLTDYYIIVDTSGGAFTVQLPALANCYNGRTIVIKDATGNAPANPITITAGAGTSLEAGVSPINLAKAALTLVFSTTGSVWYAV